MSGDSETLVIPNLGAEEGGDWRKRLGAAAPAAMAPLFTLLFRRDCRVWPEPLKASWPEAWSGVPNAPVFNWLVSDESAYAWWPDAAATALAREHGAEFRNVPAPEVLLQVHDKAFAQRAAEAERLVPRVLRGLIETFDPEDLRDADAALHRIRESVAGWPAWTRQRFALKPRIGTSGRGRVAGEGRNFDADGLRGAFPRLAKRGGALLEPWLERTRDLSVHLYVDSNAAITLLGTLEQKLSASGLYQGHRGVVDWRGRIRAGSPHDETLVQAGCDLARQAAAKGFFGPCGVDALCFRADGPEEILRPVVEFNARFTTGTVVHGLVRRALPQLGLEPGGTRDFEFVLNADAHTRSAASLVIPLGGSEAAMRPELRFT